MRLVGGIKTNLNLNNLQSEKMKKFNENFKGRHLDYFYFIFIAEYFYHGNWLFN